MKTTFNFERASLADLARGEVATVDRVDASDPIGRRLIALGLRPGTEVRVLRSAPLGDPAVYELRGFQLCLRRSEAARVEVRRRSAAA